MPSWFITVAPDDVHSHITIKLSKKNPEDPNWTNADYDDGKYFEHVIEDPKLYNLYRQAAENPVATSESYMLVMDSIMEALFQLAPETKVKKTIPVQSRRKGVFGTTLGYFFVTETQKRKSLHGHGCLWGSLPPRLLFHSD